MTWQTELLAEFDRDFREGSTAAFDEFRSIASRDPKMPRDTGRLAAGLQIRNERVGAGEASADLVSTATSDGADYGTIIDQATGKLITPKRKKALANTGSGWGPYASARQSTKHVGWWDKVSSQENFDRAVAIGLEPRGL